MAKRLYILRLSDIKIAGLEGLTDTLREFQQASEFTFPHRVIFESSDLHVFVDA